MKLVALSTRPARRLACHRARIGFKTILRARQSCGFLWPQVKSRRGGDAELCLEGVKQHGWLRRAFPAKSAGEGTN